MSTTTSATSSSTITTTFAQSAPPAKRKITAAIRQPALKSNASDSKPQLSRTTSEDQLYGAHTLRQLSKRGSQVIQVFKDSFEKLWTTTSRYRTPIYDTIEHVMRSLTRQGLISPSERKLIKLQALGSSDIDKNPTTLAATTTTAEIISKNTPNKAAWGETLLGKFRAARRKIFTSRTSSTQAHFSLSNSPSSAPIGSRGGASTTHKAGTRIPLPADMQGFLWKPIADSNGKLVILTPAALAPLVSAVELYAPGSTVPLEIGRFTGIGNENRGHYRFSKSGGGYPPGCIVRLRLIDGSTREIVIQSPGQRLEGRR